ncbi:hypothetical protein [Desmospora profundinema]|uniref:Uncharacterized protein n=1 Tax=Desmospora profundinema TaxID=1571184 RepID=A0ABU1INQ5_9BACL|nr:hypothetical protein [Desmospora profundinema]MDR6225400.1 hypothetical protein [Desmospora profundinema]
MKRIKQESKRDPMVEVQWGAQLADLKESHYRTSLLLGALIQCLIEKEWLTEADLKRAMEDLDRELDPSLDEWEPEWTKR